MSQISNQVEALRKRVAELEQKAYDLEMQLGPWSLEYVDGLKRQITDLQAQFAWTPVEKGLPTEPGWYEFYDAFRQYPGWLTCHTVHKEGMSESLAHHLRHLYTHYRRIELPKAP